MNTTTKTKKLTKINTGTEYIDSLRGRNLKIYLLGEEVVEPADHNHPIIRPSINAVAQTYDLALREPELASVTSPFTVIPGRSIHEYRRLWIFRTKFSDM